MVRSTKQIDIKSLCEIRDGAEASEKLSKFLDSVNSLSAGGWGRP
jgi:hypothetical protein